MNNIYDKLVEIQQQIQHRDPNMNFGDTIQIEAPDFDPDIDDILPTTTDQESNDPVTQGLATPILKSAEKVIKRTTPARLPRYRYPRSRLARCNSSRDSITV